MDFTENSGKMKDENKIILVFHISYKSVDVTGHRTEV